MTNKPTDSTIGSDDSETRKKDTQNPIHISPSPLQIDELKQLNPSQLQELRVNDWGHFIQYHYFVTVPNAATQLKFQKSELEGTPVWIDYDKIQKNTGDITIKGIFEELANLHKIELSKPITAPDIKKKNPTLINKVTFLIRKCLTEVIQFSRKVNVKYLHGHPAEATALHIFDPEQKKLLVLERNNNQFYLVGGIVDKTDESPKTAAIRELNEECIPQIN